MVVLVGGRFLASEVPLYQEAFEFGEHPDEADVVLQRHPPQPRIIKFLHERSFRDLGL